MNLYNYPSKARLRRAFLTVAWLSTLLPSMQGQKEVWTESFDYPVGDCLDQYQWIDHTSGNGVIQVTNGLTFPGYPEDENGAALVADNASAAYKAFPRFDTGTVYVAFLVQVAMNYKSQYFVHLWDGDLPAWMGGNDRYLYHGRVYCNENGQAGLSFGDNQQAVYTTHTDLSDQQTRLFVLRYDIIPGNNNDEVRLYIFDTLPDIEPESPTLGPLSDPAKEDIFPAGFGLRANGNDQWIVVDGIRVADTWEKALGKNLTGIMEKRNASYRLYNRYRTACLELTETADIALYTLTGKCVKNFRAGAGVCKPAEDLPHGIYLLNVNGTVLKITN